MGAKHSKAKRSGPNKKMSKTTKAAYYRAEFQCMGDVLKDGHLNQQEFTRLMTLLGLPQPDRRAKDLWNKQKKVSPGHMTEDEYVELMCDSSVESKTKMWRELFGQFDTDGSGWASRSDVIKGLEKMGIAMTPDLKAKIDAMDSDKDDRICYGDFLKMQLLHKK